MTGDMLVGVLFVVLVLVGLVVLVRDAIAEAWLDGAAHTAALLDEIARLDGELANARAERSAPSDWRAPARLVP